MRRERRPEQRRCPVTHLVALGALVFTGELPQASGLLLSSQPDPGITVNKCPSQPGS